MTYYPGRWKAICDICGFEGYNTEMVETWDNLIVHKTTCFDGPRDPLDLPQRLHPERPVRDPRPEALLAPTVVETVVPNTIADTTAASGGKIANTGGSAVTAKGVCWATSPAPDVDDSVTDEGSGTNFSCSDTTYVTETTCVAALLEWSDNFTTTLTGLTASTKYWVRAYATNAIGTGYGPQLEFTTTA